MAEDPTRAQDIQLAAAAAEGEGQARDVVAVVPPPDGGEVILATAPGRVFDLRFDPRLAEVRVVDADGDGDLDMVLVFNAGTADESRVVLENMVAAAENGNPPILQSGSTYFGADVVVQQAQALAGEQPTLETAAPDGQNLVGTGVTSYSENLGNLIDLLSAQGVIPPVDMSFPSLDPTAVEDSLLDVPPPQVEARIGAGAEFQGLVIKEDASGGFDGDAFQGDPDTLVTFSAEATDGVLTTIVITGFDNVPGWSFDVSQVEAAALDLGGTFAFDGATLTIDLTGLDQTAFLSQFAVNPPEDGDADLGTLTVEANAASGLDPSLTASFLATAEVQVDAVLDQALELGPDGVNGCDESDAPQTFSLNFDSSIVAPFAGSGDGGPDTDGSESIVVTLTLDGPLPAGASLGSTAGTVTPTGNPNEYAVTGADIEAAVDGLQVTVPAGFEGTVSGSLSATGQEANTPEGTVPGSGLEPDESDNTWTDTAAFAVTVEPGKVRPEAALGLPCDVAAIKEDSTCNLVEFSAQSGDATDELTSVTIELPGVAPGDLDVSQIAGEAGVESVAVSEAGGATTITIAFEDAADLTSFSSTFLLDAPVEDGDRDLTGVTITAHAKDITDAGQTGSGDFTTTIPVDAVLDLAPVVSQAAVPEVDESASGPQTVALGLEFSMSDAGFAGSLAGGPDTDGSESVASVCIGLSAGTLALDAGYAGSASLTDNGGGDWTLAGWADAADLEAAVEALSVTVGKGFDGTVTGSISIVTREANTPEGAAPASGLEPDTSDNIVYDSFDFSLVVDSVPTACEPYLAVDEDDLPYGNGDVVPGDDLADPSPATVLGSLDFDYGADAAGGTVDFAALDGLAVVDTDGNPMTSGSDPLTYDWNAAASTLTARADGTPVFTVEITDPATGAFAFTLLEAIDHPAAGTEDNLAIAMAYLVTDGDGDTAAGTLTVDIDDDSPASFSPGAAALANQAGGGVDTADLEADGQAGADRPGTLAFTGGSDGDLLTGSIGGGPVEALESDGHQILLTGFGTDSLTGFLDENDNGALDGGETAEVIRIDLAPGADSYTVTLSQTIDGGEVIDLSPGVTLTDGDGDSQAATLPISLVPNLFVVGSNEGDSGGETAAHQVPNPQAAISGAIAGGEGHDVLVGDPGGVAADGRFNIAIAVDVTGSIGSTNMATLNAAVASLVQQIVDEEIADATTIRLITFAVRGGQSTSGLEYAKTFAWDGTQFVAADAQTLADAIDDEVDDPSGNTNFEPALRDAADFFNGLNGGTGPADGDVNRLFFMTDGQDNAGAGGDFDPDRVPDIYGPGGLIAQDGLEIEVFGIQSFGGQLSGFDADQLNLLDDGLSPLPGEELHDGEPSPVDDVEADIAVVGFDDLGTALTETLITSLSGVGGDTVAGGDRDDIVFGDVPNTDSLAAGESLGLLPGSGWFVFEALEAGQGAATPGWDRGDTIAYLSDPANWSDLTAGGRGEGDILDGGDGDDAMIGQGGDDLMTGGSGADTFVFNLGADEGSDAILDFDGAEDRLHFADVIDGAGGDIEDVNDMVASIVDDGSGDVRVNFTNGTTVDFDGLAYAGQTSIADLVGSNAQVVVDHM